MSIQGSQTNRGPLLYPELSNATVTIETNLNHPNLSQPNYNPSMYQNNSPYQQNQGFNQNNNQIYNQNMNNMNRKMNNTNPIELNVSQNNSNVRAQFQIGQPQQPNFNYVVGNPPVVTRLPTRNEIMILQRFKGPCPRCGFQGQGYVEYTPGCASIAWAICLIFFCLLIAWLPLCTGNCRDANIMCGRCGNLRAVVQGKCCN